MGLSGTSEHVRVHGWQGLISQGGVSLGLILLIAADFPEIGQDIVALAMAVILGNILGGPVLLGRALSAPEPAADSAAPDAATGSEAAVPG